MKSIFVTLFRGMRVKGEGSSRREREVRVHFPRFALRTAEDVLFENLLRSS